MHRTKLYGYVNISEQYLECYIIADESCLREYVGYGLGNAFYDKGVGMCRGFSLNAGVIKTQVCILHVIKLVIMH